MNEAPRVQPCAAPALHRLLTLPGAKCPFGPGDVACRGFALFPRHGDGGARHREE